MLRKRATRRSAGKQQRALALNKRPRVVAVNALPDAPDQVAAAGRVEARLHSIVKEALRNMGED